ncbi:hypothetical protein JX266_006480 [Neoarthrinium moseri]|nr:hypothetical protein JX266_006480 [Neoarthrinium moseri]
MSVDERPAPQGWCDKSCFTWKKDELLASENSKRGLPTSGKSIRQMAMDRCFYDMELPVGRWAQASKKLLPLWPQTRACMVTYLEGLPPSELVLAEFQKLTNYTLKPPVMTLIIKTFKEADDETFAGFPIYGDKGASPSEGTQPDGAAGPADDSSQMAQFTARKWSGMSITQKIMCLEGFCRDFRVPGAPDADEAQRSRLADERWKSLAAESQVQCLHKFVERGKKASEQREESDARVEEMASTIKAQQRQYLDKPLFGGQPGRRQGSPNIGDTQLESKSSDLIETFASTLIGSPAPATHTRPATVGLSPSPSPSPPACSTSAAQAVAGDAAQRATKRVAQLSRQVGEVLAGVQDDPSRLVPFLQLLSSLEETRDGMSADADKLGRTIFHWNRVSQVRHLMGSGSGSPAGEASPQEILDAAAARKQLRDQVGVLNDMLFQALAVYSEAVLSLVGFGTRSTR